MGSMLGVVKAETIIFANSDSPPKHATLRSNSKDWLVQSCDNVFE